MLKVGVQTGPWYDDKDPDASFAFIKECGFEAVDFNINNYVSVSDLLASEGAPVSFFSQPLEELFKFFTPFKEAARKHGVAVAQMHAPFPSWTREREDVNEHILESFEKCLEIAKFLDCPAVVVHPVSAQPTWENFTKDDEWRVNMGIYRRLIPTAVRTGVTVCLENMFTRRPLRILEGACADALEVCQYVDALNEEAGCRAFGFCLDTGHANLVGRNLYHFIKTLGERLTVLHLNDNNGQDDLHMMPYSCLTKGNDTAMDFEGLLKGLKEINYQGDLSFETFRVLTVFPESVHTEALKLISAIGRDWKARLEA